MYTITDREFGQLAEFIRKNYGINLKEEKRALVVGRLRNVLAQKNMKNFSEYFEHVLSDKTGEAAAELVNKITTNYTFYMREADHFFYFRDVVLPYLVSKGISSDPDIEVVAVAGDAYEAADKIVMYKPDIMTCDVEMPKMNGIDFIRRLLPQYPLPVIVVSSVSGVVFDAMEAGAVDFVAKPDIHSVKSVEQFIHEMIDKIKIASVAKVSTALTKKRILTDISRITLDTDKLIFIGASTGGTEAISSILKQLPETVPGIVIVQHIPPVFSRMFVERLNRTANLNVKEAQSGDYIERGRVLVAPGDRHIKIVRIGRRYKVHCFESEKVNGHRPSVDVLFESAAKECNGKAIGVILTGMGYDGAKGLLSMRKKGARTIGQDEASSVVYGMPKVAYNIGAVEIQAALEKIPQIICSLL